MRGLSSGLWATSSPPCRERLPGLTKRQRHCSTRSLPPKAARGDLRIRMLPDVKDADGKIHRTLELSDPMFGPLVLFVDPDSHLIAKQAYVVHAPGQPLIEELFSDYRPVDGLNVAFVAEVR